MDVLRTALDEALDGRGRCLSVVGEPGIGKSRLARLVTEWAVELGVPAVTGRAVPGPSPAAYRPVTEALMQLIRRRPLGEDPDLAPWLPLLHPLIPMLVPAPPDTAETRVNLRAEAVLKLMNRSAPEGLVVVLEDIHWADPDTVALVEYLGDNVGDLPLLMVVTLADEPSSAALAVARRRRVGATVTSLELDRLSPDEAAAMVRACRPGASPEVIERIRRTSDGIPLLVEELLAAPGLPADVTETVRARLDALPDAQRTVVESAALLGRRIDWTLLSATTGLDTDAVTAALEAGVDASLLVGHGAELRFRHSVTREAVVSSMVPPLRRRLAADALAALLSCRPVLDREQRELAADLAVHADDRRQAGILTAESGREWRSVGALASAVETLQRAADLLVGLPERSAVELDLIEALASAGRFDDAATTGGRLIRRLGSGPDAAPTRIEAHLRLADAGIGAARWQMARHHIAEARRIQPGLTTPAGISRVTLLEADLAMAGDDHGEAVALATAVLAGPDVQPADRCRALGIVGRGRRPVEMEAAGVAFEEMLVTAEAADLPLWRLRALRGLGMLEMADHAGVERLQEARATAERLGAMGAAAVLDLQLAATSTLRWDPDACEVHARAAIATAGRLALHDVRARALMLLAAAASMRADTGATEHWAAESTASAPGDRMLEGFGWTLSGMALLLAGRDDDAIEPWARGTAVLAGLPNAEPAVVRALWPLLLAARSDRRATSAIAEARSLGVEAVRLNRSLIGYAEAVLAGRRGDVTRAHGLVATADTGWSGCGTWRDLCRFLAGPSAQADGWADVDDWLSGVARCFTANGLTVLSSRCQALDAVRVANPWSELGVTNREADVVRLVAEGLTNKEIAGRLHRSPRTVEKHVESLLRRTGTHSRTELVTHLVLTPPPTRP